MSDDNRSEKARKSVNDYLASVKRDVAVHVPPRRSAMNRFLAGACGCLFFVVLMVYFVFAVIYTRFLTNSGSSFLEALYYAIKYPWAVLWKLLDNVFMVRREPKSTTPPVYSPASAICADLITLPEFSGANFSAGDQAIQQRATNPGSPGSPVQWIREAVNHHIEFVVAAIANLP